MGLLERFLNRGKKSEARGTRTMGKKISEDGRTVFAFKAYTPERAAFALAGKVIAFSSGPPLEDKIRREARSPGANVIVLEAEEWNAPSPGSLSQADIIAAFPQVVARASRTLTDGFGVGRLTPDQMTDRGAGAMPHPTGHVLFLFNIPGRWEKTESG